MSDINTLLAEFTNQANHPFYPWMFRHEGREHTRHIVFSALIHGNETGPLPAFLWAITALKAGDLYYGGTLTFILGNPEAAQKDQRFLESDLNRMFLDTPLDTHESRRAKILAQIFDEADVLIDLHQTILPSAQAFYICPWSEKSSLWARALAICSSAIDATPATGPVKTRCADEYVWLQHKPAVTIELGEKGIHEHADTLAKKAIQRGILIAEALEKGSSLESLAQIQPELILFQTAHRESYSSDDLLLRQGIINFQPVHKGEILSAENTPEIRSPIDGCILFPKYPAFDTDGNPLARPQEIFRIITPATK